MGMHHRKRRTGAGGHGGNLQALIVKCTDYHICLIADQCRNHGKWDEQGRVVMFVVYMLHFSVEERQIGFSR